MKKAHLALTGLALAGITFAQSAPIGRWLGQVVREDTSNKHYDAGRVATGYWQTWIKSDWDPAMRIDRNWKMERWTVIDPDGNALTSYNPGASEGFIIPEGCTFWFGPYAPQNAGEQIPAVAYTCAVDLAN